MKRLMILDPYLENPFSEYRWPPCRSDLGVQSRLMTSTIIPETVSFPGKDIDILSSQPSSSFPNPLLLAELHFLPAPFIGVIIDCPVWPPLWAPPH